jgi:hypothetical protein
MKKMTLLNYLTILLGVVAIVSIGFTPAFAEKGVETHEESIGDEAVGDNGEIYPFDEQELFDDSFGDGTQATWITAWDFTPHCGPFNYLGAGTSSLSQRYATSGCGWFQGPVRLPSGARVTQVSYFFYRTAGSVNVSFFRENSPTSTTTLINANYAGPLSGWLSWTFPRNDRISNGQGWYHTRFNLDSSLGSAQRFWGVRILWYRELRAGLSHPFIDLRYPDGQPYGPVFVNSIAALWQSGITSGTTAITYGPNEFVTRAQMAVFLAKALGLYWAYPTY